ncbi:hypothetical protein LQL77_32635, partial [Rhodococcus cerastii]|nr:hypothetical protein [Rhodococcus cerastii]
SSSSEEGEPLTWMSSQRFQVGEDGPSVQVSRQVGGGCVVVGRGVTETVIECADIEMAVLGSMVQVHLGGAVSAEVVETKTGSINNSLDYDTRSLDTLRGRTGTVRPGERTLLTNPDPRRPDWIFGLDGKLGNSGTARITFRTVR